MVAAVPAPLAVVPAARWLPFMGGLLLAGCVGGGGGSEPIPELRPWTPPDGQSCSVAGSPGPVEGLVDSVEVRHVVEGRGIPDGGVVISFATDSAGALSRFRLAETTLPRGATEDVVDAIESLVALPVSGPRRGGRLLIRVEEGRLTDLRTGRYRACRPAVTNRDVVSQALSEIYRRTEQTASATVRLFVDTAGTATQIRLQKGTQSMDVDLQLVAAARKLRFHPATIDGDPVAVWVQLDLSVEPWCPPARDSVAWARLDPFDACWKQSRAPVHWRP